MTLAFSPPILLCAVKGCALWLLVIKHYICGSLSKITARICECTTGQSDTSTFVYNKGAVGDKLQLICSGRKLLEGHEV